MISGPSHGPYLGLRMWSPEAPGLRVTEVRQSRHGTERGVGDRPRLPDLGLYLLLDDLLARQPPPQTPGPGGDCRATWQIAGNATVRYPGDVCGDRVAVYHGDLDVPLVVSALHHGAQSDLLAGLHPGQRGVASLVSTHPSGRALRGPEEGDGVVGTLPIDGGHLELLVVQLYVAHIAGWQYLGTVWSTLNYFF